MESYRRYLIPEPISDIRNLYGSWEARQMDTKTFEERLLTVKEGDEVVFVFSAMVHWATKYLALFNAKPWMFNVAEDSEIKWDAVNLYMLLKVDSFSPLRVKCRVMTAFDKNVLSLDWVLENIAPLLDDFIVLKPE